MLKFLILQFVYNKYGWIISVWLLLPSLIFVLHERSKSIQQYLVSLNKNRALIYNGCGIEPNVGANSNLWILSKFIFST